MKLVDYGFHWAEDPNKRTAVIIQIGFYLRNIKLCIKELYPV